MEGELERANHRTAVAMDNARNIDVAVREASPAPHIKCFAHMLNLATKAGLSTLCQLFAGSSEAGCSLLPPKLHSHHCVHI